MSRDETNLSHAHAAESMALRYIEDGQCDSENLEPVALAILAVSARLGDLTDGFRALGRTVREITTRETNGNGRP